MPTGSAATAQRSPAEGGHAGHVLADGDDGRKEVVQQLVLQHQVRHRLDVRRQSEILVVVPCTRRRVESDSTGYVLVATEQGCSLRLRARHHRVDIAQTLTQDLFDASAAASEHDVFRRNDYPRWIAQSPPVRCAAPLTGESHLQAMMVVHHGRDAVEPVAVELVLVDPPARVRYQETQRLPVACTASDTLYVLWRSIAGPRPMSQHGGAHTAPIVGQTRCVGDAGCRLTVHTPAQRKVI